jgi:hypothetical protein
LPEPTSSNQPDPKPSASPATTGAPPDAESRSDASPAVEASLADTSGMGTIVAIGCIGATLFLIVLGLIYIAVVQLVG